MKTIEVNLYQFSELLPEIQKKVLNHFRENEDFNWITQDANNTFEKFAEIFNIDWRLIDYTEPDRNDYKINIDSRILELSGVRLMAHIWTNYRRELFKGKYYQVSSKKHLIHKRIKSQLMKDGYCFNAYYSAIQLQSSCVLTGVCYDDDVLSPIYDYLNKPNDRADFETLLNDCIYSLCGSVSDEIEYNSTDEAIIENIEANDYYFTENGEIA